jgi:hypothetical protein
MENDYWRMVRPKRYWTVQQWKKVRKTHEKRIGDNTYYLDMQEMLCKKFDIILVNYRTKREIAMGIIKAVNFRNFDRGMKIFDDAMKEFDSMMKDFGKELGDGNASHQKITGKKRRAQPRNTLTLWGNTSDAPRIWGTKKETAAPKRRKRTAKKKTGVAGSGIERLVGKKKRPIF